MLETRAGYTRVKDDDEKERERERKQSPPLLGIHFFMPFERERERKLQRDKEKALIKGQIEGNEGDRK